MHNVYFILFIQFLKLLTNTSKMQLIETTNFRKREKQKNVVRFARILLKYKRLFRSNLVICENQFENPQKQIFSVLVFNDREHFSMIGKTFLNDREHF